VASAGARAGFVIALLAVGASGAAWLVASERAESSAAPPARRESRLTGRDGGGKAERGRLPTFAPVPGNPLPRFEPPAAAPPPPPRLPDAVGLLAGGPEHHALHGRVMAHGAEGWTASSGSDFEQGFRIGLPGPGVYDFTALAEGWVQATSVRGAYETGTVERPFDIEMLPVGTVHGRVVFPRPELVVPCRIGVASESQHALLREHLDVVFQRGARPAEDGTFEVALHPRIPSVVSCTAELPHAPRLESRDVLPETGELLFEWSEELLRGARIEGTVTDAASRASMSGFEVQLWRAGDVQEAGRLERLPVHARGDVVAPGHFRAEHLVDGAELYVGASSLGFISDTQGPFAAGDRSSSTVKLALHTPGSLRVRVVDAAGRELPDAEVQCCIVEQPWPHLDEGFVSSLYERTRPTVLGDGTRLFRDLSPGEFWVAAASGNLVSVPSRAQVMDAETRSIDLVAIDLREADEKPRGDLFVNVIDTAGAPIAGVTVSAARCLGPTVPDAFDMERTDAGGFAKLTGLPVGLCRVSCSAPGAIELRSPIVGVLPGSTTSCVLRVTARVPATLPRR